MYRIITVLGAIVVLSASTGAVSAGMPTPLPTDVAKVLELDQSAERRLEAISFFVVVLLVAAVVIRALWNYLQRDFAALPRLSFGKALVGVVLWGMLFIIVLTMISGARELLTPGAWEKDGLTYKLADHRLMARQQQLERLRFALWQYAAEHEGRFPEDDDNGAIVPELWEVPGAAGMRYRYVAGRNVGGLGRILAYEPAVFGESRFVLLADGQITSMRSEQIRTELDSGNPS